MLFRPWFSVPVLLVAELGNSRASMRGRITERGLTRPRVSPGEEWIYMTMAGTGSKVLELYRQLNRTHQAHYTFLATRHLFIPGEMVDPLRRFLHPPPTPITPRSSRLTTKPRPATGVPGRLGELGHVYFWPGKFGLGGGCME
jgi:hypothetical protein